jgi:transcription antitermination protein NusB
MALSHQKFREIVFQLLFSQALGHAEESHLIDLIMHELAVSKRNVRLAQEKVRMIQQKMNEIDHLIGSLSISYDFDRIQVVTKNILRLSLYELLFDEQIPPKVAISEGIRLSRKFSTPESAAFVNALLDQYLKNQSGINQNLANVNQMSETLKKSEEIAEELAQMESHPENLFS